MLYNLWRRGTCQCSYRLKARCFSSFLHLNISSRGADALTFPHPLLDPLFNGHQQPDYSNAQELQDAKEQSRHDGLRSNHVGLSFTSNLDEDAVGQLGKDGIPQQTSQLEHELPQAPFAWSRCPPTGNIKVKLETIQDLLEEGTTEEVIEGVWKATEDGAVAAAIPSTTVIEILRRLDPCDNFAPFRQPYAQRDPKHYRTLNTSRHKRYASLSRVRKLAWDLCQNRMESGRSVGVREYAAFLRLARGTFDGPLASRIMDALLSRNLKPDLDCYNYYFEAKCWSDAWWASERHLLRVFPYAQKQRQQARSRRVSSNRVIHPHIVGEGGVKSEVTAMYTHMIENGTMPDCTSYGHLITALAREGDLQGVKAVMMRVWYVDVDAVCARGSSAAISLNPDSPMYPDGELIFKIAHAFGTNSEVSTALRLVDFLSRQFNVPIPTYAWEELLNWTFTLSTRRSKLRKVDGAQLGKLPNHTVEDMWNVLINKPYKCQPTLAMYDWMIRSQRRRHRLLPTLEYVVKGFELHQRNEQILAEHVAQTTHDSSREHDQISDQLRSTRALSLDMIRAWCKLLFTDYEWIIGHPHETNENQRPLLWERQLLPYVVDAFWQFTQEHLPRMSYRMESGHVELTD
ncbi:MAG: hypothetical protein OHK93_008653 [Ramalina farinacea]|uniref:Pentatricopeptide repeat domain-containing protein n=1 Tax=Ramalina farinacea TaxID=258253 RepID=A0AA43TWR2_9LECA|nr:hypothetical protein [Ramalina farinacea]